MVHCQEIPQTSDNVSLSRRASKVSMHQKAHEDNNEYAIADTVRWSYTCKLEARQGGTPPC